jgi:hypothetical protein
VFLTRRVASHGLERLQKRARSERPWTDIGALRSASPSFFQKRPDAPPILKDVLRATPVVQR